MTSSGDGDVDETTVFVVNVGHDEAVASRYEVGDGNDLLIIDDDDDSSVGGDDRFIRAVIGYERQRGGDEFTDSIDVWSWESNCLIFDVWIAGDAGKDVDDFISTRVSVVFVLVGEVIVILVDGEIARGDCKVPLSRAGRIFVNVLVAVRWDEGTVGKLPFRNNDEILNDDETDDEDDWSIWVRKAFSVEERISSFSLLKIDKKNESLVKFLVEKKGQLTYHQFVDLIEVVCVFHEHSYRMQFDPMYWSGMMVERLLESWLINVGLFVDSSQAEECSTKTRRMTLSVYNDIKKKEKKKLSKWKQKQII